MTTTDCGIPRVLTAIRSAVCLLAVTSRFRRLTGTAACTPHTATCRHSDVSALPECERVGSADGSKSVSEEVAYSCCAACPDVRGLSSLFV